MPRHAIPRAWNDKFPHVSSVAVAPDAALYASSLGQGVYRIDPNGEWEALEREWPEGATVNRLSVNRGVLTACTSKGLYVYNRDRWEATDVAVPAYGFLEGGGGRMLAATHYGIWCRTEDGWLNWAYPDSIIYDLLYLPQFIVAGRDNGMALYDRLTGEWMEFVLADAVTSVAVYRGRLVGSGGCGQLIVGNRRGGFDTFRLPGIFIVSLISKGRDVYACTDKGLFRLGMFRDSVALLPVRLGFPVADADWDGETLVMATLFRGIESI
ncbi:hypothetical protein ACFFNY_31165 [Paenibacillus hodogayensis]|uniref:WD40 repeat domain-containing protein n=1 Tax=Paenibacillus hodogayensis TaxID=279208 RepID=A0ABV5W658_9BACL